MPRTERASPSGHRRLRVPVHAAALAALLAGCSVRELAARSFASTLSESSDVFASDDDPELVGDALPFVLKAIELLLADSPRDPELLRLACATFTQYAVGFVLAEAERIEDADWRRAQELEQRALGLLLRARGYGEAALAARHPDIGAELARDPEKAAERLDAREVAAAYWTAAAWGKAIVLGLDRPELIADLDAVRALMERALALDESWDDGSLHEAMISLESLTALGGSVAKAREHFARAVELSGGARASPYVTLAEDVALAAQDRAEFEALLEQALAVDLEREPGARLANRIQQRRARLLLDRADELFLEPLEAGEEAAE